MTWLSENPWPLAGTCLILAMIFLVALRITQQGKFLIRALAALGAAGLILLVEWFWVTDRERIANVIYDMADAVKTGDIARFEAHLAEEFNPPGGGLARSAMRGAIQQMDFEFIRISKLRATAGDLTKRGKADFFAMAAWEPHDRIPYKTVPPPGVGFSVGFIEEDGEWKVSRIEVTQAPQGTDPGSVSQYISGIGGSRGD